jgi:hypothetical protein
MSIQGSFNSMLSSLVFATGQMRQARAQERIAKSQEELSEAKLQGVKAQANYYTEKAGKEKALGQAALSNAETRRMEAETAAKNAETAAAHEESIAPKRAAESKMTEAEASYRRAEAGALREDTRGKKLDRQIRAADAGIDASKAKKAQLEQQAMDSYLERADEIQGGRQSVTSLKETIEGKRNG